MCGAVRKKYFYLLYLGKIMINIKECLPYCAHLCEGDTGGWEVWKDHFYISVRTFPYRAHALLQLSFSRKPSRVIWGKDYGPFLLFFFVLLLPSLLNISEYISYYFQIK